MVGNNAAGPADCFSPGDNELPPSLTAEKPSVKFVDFCCAVELWKYPIIKQRRLANHLSETHLVWNTIYGKWKT